MHAILFKHFIASMKKIIDEMTGIQMGVENILETQDEITTPGVVSIVSFSGNFKGRLLLSIEKELMLKIVENILGEKVDSIFHENVFYTIQEINNTIAGDANTAINNEFKSSLRLSPPMSFVGEELTISGHQLKGKEIVFRSEYGRIRAMIGFEGRLEE